MGLKRMIKRIRKRKVKRSLMPDDFEVARIGLRKAWYDLLEREGEKRGVHMPLPNYQMLDATWRLAEENLRKRDYESAARMLYLYLWTGSGRSTVVDLTDTTMLRECYQAVHAWVEKNAETLAIYLFSL